MTIKYGAFENDPTRFTDTEAWVYQTHDKVWRQMNPAEIRFNAHVLSEDKYREEFGEVPPLPADAFKA